VTDEVGAASQVNQYWELVWKDTDIGHAESLA